MAIVEKRILTAQDLEPHGAGCPLCDRVFEVGDVEALVTTNFVPKECVPHGAPPARGSIPVRVGVCCECAELPDVLDRIRALP